MKKNINKRLLQRIFIILFLYGLGCLGKLFSQRQIIGKWLSEDKKGIVEVYEYNKKFFGKIVWLQDPTLLDTKNKKVSDRDRPLLHCIVIKDLFYANNEWQKGTVYDPKRGETFKCKIWIENKCLKVRGYSGISYATETWSKVN